ncbi:MAG: four helix bundle protein [Prevotellaceae bacterium]|jgi:four helix bundle protein|nr:four helix bundle protein [Prevotellaceae bacterium]
MKGGYQDFKDLLAYKKAFEQGCRIFELSLSFPKEERYSLTDQIRRSSRSVCANLAEAYRKRNYLKHFQLKVTDCLGENSETLVWLDFAKHHNYISENVYKEHIELNEEISKLLQYMYNNPEKFGVDSKP